VIARAEPDVVALQELDIGRARSGRLDQPHILASRLAMTAHFHSVAKKVSEPYGIAILTALPARVVKAGPLPALTLARHVEPRGAIWLALDLGGGVELNVVNTHMSLVGRERARQAAALLGPDWLGRLDPAAPALLMGDLNSVPRSTAYRAFSRRLDDAQRLWGLGRPRATFPARLPALRLDHVFVNSAALRVRGVEVPRDVLTRAASDHLPLVVDLELVDRDAEPDGAPPTADIGALRRRRRVWPVGKGRADAPAGR
jgi:endonuclease/exonuclease/phosphatase family metal-dependent hydrolase